MIDGVVGSLTIQDLCFVGSALVVDTASNSITIEAGSRLRGIRLNLGATVLASSPKVSIAYDSCRVEFTSLVPPLRRGPRSQSLGWYRGDCFDLDQEVL